MSDEMNEFDAEAFDQQPREEKKRSTFLTVLCILSLIWGIIQVYLEVSAGIDGPIPEEDMAKIEAEIDKIGKPEVEEAELDTAAEVSSNVETSVEDNDEEEVEISEEDKIAQEFAQGSIDYLRKSNEVWTELHFTTAVLYLMGLFGVWRMWKLDKRGYFMYGAAHLLITFLPALFVTTNSYIWLIIGFWLFMTAVFLVLYGLNLKHMK